MELANEQVVDGGVSPSHGAKYELNLEGVVREWPRRTITVPEIRELAGWTVDQQVVMVDLKTNDEITLDEDATVELKPGHGFSKKVKFKRGRR
ncbi:multiubiquitin domain-containing protein [Kribbella sp. NPDC005582]|uniref:multiubiquitin domain-containing protein n=1 Tax=Kribbella sp. NPDC005582 TaxID=3156893 RepID=UPI0033B66659